MALDFRNTNTLWASILAETLWRLGLQTAIVCPGSRSAPLAVAFAQHPVIDAVPILDERSAAFFALGIARRSGSPVALICTSGTAGANFYPAVIEAQESCVPLLLLTADRPPELRHCHAGQAIHQTHLFGTYANWYTELSLPEATPTLLAYLRQTAIHTWERSLFPQPGPVHLNIPFRDPLAPLPDIDLSPLAHQFDEALFFQMVASLPEPSLPILRAADVPISHWRFCEHGLIIAGPAIPHDSLAYCEAIAQLSQQLGWPVLADALSPLRNVDEQIPYLITTYDIALRNSEYATQLQPQQVIRVGELPTSKTLRQWLQERSIPQWVIDPSDQNLDPLHSCSQHLRTTVEALAPFLSDLPEANQAEALYLKSWLMVESTLRKAIATTLISTKLLRESKAAWLLSQVLPPNTPVFIANSMPIRDAEWFWQPGNLHIQPYFNRGANGIDGTLSSALGMAYRQQSSVLLTGDLSLLHDTNGFLILPQWQGHLTIVLINNSGGGIFGMLPIAAFEPPFETFFATPQSVNFAQLCATYGVAHTLIESWEHLTALLNPLPTQGVRVLEVVCDRAQDAQWRQVQLKRLSHLPIL
jgi:2-succinyl-5-enolpyruvyl-6-hydroxy-3-cyclohexene-1-carboxylate synthase